MENATVFYALIVLALVVAFLAALLLKLYYLCAAHNAHLASRLYDLEKEVNGPFGGKAGKVEGIIPRLKEHAEKLKSLDSLAGDHYGYICNLQSAVDRGSKDTQGLATQMGHEIHRIEAMASELGSRSAKSSELVEAISGEARGLTLAAEGVAQFVFKLAGQPSD